MTEVEQPDESFRIADLYKQQGNEELKNNNYSAAVAHYTDAINLHPTAIFYSNRAQAQIKLENHGSAVLDASQAIILDKDYLKAYYRRAVAYCAILRYDQALKDVNIVLSRAPSDKGAKDLKKKIQLMLRQIAFEKAISVNDKIIFDEIDFDSIVPEVNWEGPDLNISVTVDEEKHQTVKVDMTHEYIDSMVEVFKNGGKIPKRHAFAIVCAANQLFEESPALVEIGLARNKTASKEIQKGSAQLISICGDTHGQFYDVLNIFESYGNVSPEHIYLFNGDFVDRGSWSCEVALLFYSLKILYPEYMFLNRGNHETNDMNKAYGFEDECKYKYGQKLFLAFAESFNSLPYATLIGQEYLVMHGGLFSDDSKTVADIRNIKKTKQRQPPKEGIEMELLWTDPQVAEGRTPSKRGIGSQFGPDVTARFCEANGLKAVIRSHEVRMGGYELEHNGKLITVFSAPNYCDVQRNLGAMVKLTLNDDKEYEMNFETFSEVPHPDLKPMAYSQNMGF